MAVWAEPTGSLLLPPIVFILHLKLWTCIILNYRFDIVLTCHRPSSLPYFSIKSLSLSWEQKRSPLLIWLHLIRLSYLLSCSCFQHVVLLDFFFSSASHELNFSFRSHSSTILPVELPSDKQPKRNWHDSEPAIHPFLSPVFVGCCCDWW